MCGMSGVAGRLVVSSPSVCGVWTHRMLRQFSEPACIKACGSDRASHHYQLRTGRGLVLRLREAADDQRCGVASAALASGKSARAWTRRKGASQLGIAPELAGIYFLQAYCYGKVAIGQPITTSQKGPEREHQNHEHAADLISRYIGLDQELLEPACRCWS
jgi:hypothetical protein